MSLIEGKSQLIRTEKVEFLFYDRQATANLDPSGSILYDTTSSIRKAASKKIR